MSRATKLKDDRLPAESTAAYSVRHLASGDAARWDAFVRESSGGTFYHLAGWKSVIENQLHHPAYYLYCECEGEILAVLPLVHLKSLLFGNALTSLPFLVYGGPVGECEKATEQVVSAAKELAQELNVDYLELRNQTPLAGDWQTKNTHVTFRKTLDPDPEANLMAIPRKQRAMIRKGIKAGLVAESDQDADRLYAAMLVCKRNLGTPFFGARWLRAICDEFGDQVEITTVVHKQETVCSVMSFRYAKEILPYYGGGGELARDLKGNDFMYWSVMEKACRDGIEVFDYGRSTIDSGAYRFKKHWGFEPEPLHYQYFLVKSDSMPNLNPSNPRYRMLIDAWKRLPLPIAAALGPPLAKRLG